eukprot:TRINITY_DN298_c4_g1_i1.p1 TRINITY_DN298_c4_g1~~TRINITY_DN298_c4_g1_i1.p1  ORF type:complete len:530 (+),score=145.98 TRINITY_DN298_c4_g1_i1:161-1750(+)
MAQLPEDWKSYVDANTGRTYYINDKTKKTQWDVPTTTTTEAAAAAAAAATGATPTPTAIAPAAAATTPVAAGATAAPAAPPEAKQPPAPPAAPAEAPQPPTQAAPAPAAPAAPAPAAEKEELPANWESRVDENSNRLYYFNRETGEASWKNPAKLAPEDTGLPPGWESHRDPNTGTTYYTNAALSLSQWEKPKAEPGPSAPAAAGSAATSAVTTTPAGPASTQPATASTAAPTPAAAAAPSQPAALSSAGTAAAKPRVAPGSVTRKPSTARQNPAPVKRQPQQLARSPLATPTAATDAKPIDAVDDDEEYEVDYDAEEYAPLEVYRPPRPQKEKDKKKDKGEPQEPDMSATQHKFVIVGAGAVGKSALVVRFIKGNFVAEYDPTIEDSYRRQYLVDDRPCHLDVLDTAGQEEYSALRDNYMQTGEGFLVVFSVNSRRSFREVPTFLQHIREVKDADVVPTIIVGSKCDLDSEIPQRVLNELCDKNNCPFVPCSAKTNQNVELVFSELVRECRRLAPERAKRKGGKCVLL